MKFFAYLALVGSAFASKINQKHVTIHHAPIKATLLGVKNRVMELPQQEDVDRWVKAQLEDDGSITIDEIHLALANWEQATGKMVTDKEWALIERAFAMMDLNDDGHVTEDELKCVVE